MARWERNDKGRAAPIGPKTSPCSFLFRFFFISGSGCSSMRHQPRDAPPRSALMAAMRSDCVRFWPSLDALHSCPTQLSHWPPSPKYRLPTGCLIWCTTPHHGKLLQILYVTALGRAGSAAPACCRFCTMTEPKTWVQWGDAGLSSALNLVGAGYQDSISPQNQHDPDPRVDWPSTTRLTMVSEDIHLARHFLRPCAPFT